MKRREILFVLGAGALAWPLAARAQPDRPVVGVLGAGSAAQNAPWLAGFVAGLKDAGLVDGESVTIEYRWADGDYARLPAMAADLVRRQVAVIFASGGAAPVQAAMAATSSIPIVFSAGADPVRQGFVKSIARPEGNVTGAVFAFESLGAKRLELLRELIPGAATIGVLGNWEAGSSSSEADRRQVEAAGTAAGLRIISVTAKSEPELDAAFATLVREGAQGVVVGIDGFLGFARERIVDLATRHAIPAIYFEREFISAGGLMSYGISVRAVYRQVGLYAGRILRGAKPGELPVVAMTTFELILNLKAAKAIGLTVPPTLLIAADEVIE